MFYMISLFTLIDPVLRMFRIVAYKTRVIYIVYLKRNQSIDMSSIVDLSSIIVKNQLTTSDISFGKQSPSKLHRLI